MRDSPNENPHLELALQSGDYVLVHGHMDEDRFYFGETLTGRTGLVPSNYVERVPNYLILQNAARTSTAQISPPNCNSGIDSNNLNRIQKVNDYSPNCIDSNSPITVRNSPLLNNQKSTSTKSTSTRSPLIKPSTLDECSLLTDNTSINLNTISNYKDCTSMNYIDNDTSALPSTSFNFFNANNNNNINNNNNKTSFHNSNNINDNKQNSSFNCSSHCSGNENYIKDLNRSNSPSFVLNVPMHHAQIAHDFTDFSYLDKLNNDNNNNSDRFSQNNYSDKFQLPDSVCPYPPIDVSKITVQEVKQSDQPNGIHSFLFKKYLLIIN